MPIHRFQPELEFPTIERCSITELRNVSADADCSIARARVAPGDTTQWHRLRGVVEHYVIVEGQGMVEVGDDPPTPVSVLDVVSIPANSRQRITNTGRGDLSFLCVCLPRFVPECYESLE
jgi:mannose-6-phosphate isomerase-like protein (cupin superfamily)